MSHCKSLVSLLIDNKLQLKLRMCKALSITIWFCNLQSHIPSAIMWSPLGMVPGGSKAFLVTFLSNHWFQVMCSVVPDSTKKALSWSVLPSMLTVGEALVSYWKMFEESLVLFSQQNKYGARFWVCVGYPCLSFSYFPYMATNPDTWYVWNNHPCCDPCFV